MALKKSLTLRSGQTVEYFRVTSFRWDRGTREASAIFAAYKDAEAAQGGADPTLGVIAKLRLTGAAFDQYLSPSTTDPVAQIYTAAVACPVVSDYGSDLFATAQPV
jgi:hypothetical protein